MLRAMVEGTATATVRHRSMKGWRLLIVQPVDMAGKPKGDPLLAIDRLGAGRGTEVVISNDGRSVREMIGDDNTPMRWSVIGLID